MSSAPSGIDPQPAFDPDELRNREPVRTLHGRNRTKADILVYRCRGRDVALKDYRRRPFWIRHTLGRWSIAREARAYRAAGGLDGLPPFLGRVGPFALATEWVEARPIADLDASRIDRGTFERASAILDRLHARGVALSDLHHRDLLVAADGRVFVVDLAAAWVAGRSAGMFRRFCALDRIALARIEARFSGADPAQAAAAAGGDTARWYRRGRRVKSALNRLRRRDG